MILRPHIVIVLLLGLPGSGLSEVRAQDLPFHTRPWEIARTFIKETCDPSDTINREAFRSRLTGAAANIELASLRGLWPRHVDVYIDSTILLPPVRGLEREAIWVTTYSEGNYDNAYFYFQHDSIWRIEHFTRIPSRELGERMNRELRQSDSSDTEYPILKEALQRAIWPDWKKKKFFDSTGADLGRIAHLFSRYGGSRSYQLMVPEETDSLDEYRLLDDDLQEQDRVMIKLGPSIVERVRRRGFLRISKTDSSILFPLVEFEDYSSGYLKLLGEAEPPVPDPDGYIVLRPLGDRWYLYRRRAFAH